MGVQSGPYTPVNSLSKPSFTLCNLSEWQKGQSGFGVGYLVLTRLSGGRKGIASARGCHFSLVIAVS